MELRQLKPIPSSAIGQRITALRYDAEAGYVVVELESGEELWVSADCEGVSRVSHGAVEALGHWPRLESKAAP